MKWPWWCSSHTSSRPFAAVDFLGPLPERGGMGAGWAVWAVRRMYLEPIWPLFLEFEISKIGSFTIMSTIMFLGERVRLDGWLRSFCWTIVGFLVIWFVSFFLPELFLVFGIPSPVMQHFYPWEKFVSIFVVVFVLCLFWTRFRLWAEFCVVRRVCIFQAVMSLWLCRDHLALVQCKSFQAFLAARMRYTKIHQTSHKKRCFWLEGRWLLGKQYLRALWVYTRLCSPTPAFFEELIDRLGGFWPPHEPAPAGFPSWLHKAIKWLWAVFGVFLGGKSRRTKPDGFSFAFLGRIWLTRKSGTSRLGLVLLLKQSAAYRSGAFLEGRHTTGRKNQKQGISSLWWPDFLDLKAIMIIHP